MSLTTTFARHFSPRRTVAVAGLTTLALLATVGPAQAADAVTSGKAPAVHQSLEAQTGSLNDDVELTDDAIAGLEEVLSTLVSIPDDVLEEGQEATAAWVERTQADQGGVSTRKFDAALCARGVLVAVGSNVFAVAKIWKLKKAIDKIGGVKKFVSKIQDQKKRGKKSFKKALMAVLEEGGQGIVTIGMEIFGVSEVSKHCW